MDEYDLCRFCTAEYDCNEGCDVCNYEEIEDTNKRHNHKGSKRKYTRNHKRRINKKYKKTIYSYGLHHPSPYKFGWEDDDFYLYHSVDYSLDEIKYIYKTSNAQSKYLKNWCNRNIRRIKICNNLIEEDMNYVIKHECYDLSEDYDYFGYCDGYHDLDKYDIYDNFITFQRGDYKKLSEYWYSLC